MKEMVTAAVAMLLAFSVVSGGFSAYRGIVQRNAVIAEEEVVEESESDNLDEPVEAEGEEPAETGEEESESLYGEGAEEGTEEESEEDPYRACFEFLARMRSADCKEAHVKHALFYDAAAVLSGDQMEMEEMRQACEEYAAMQAAGRSFDGNKDFSILQYRITRQNQNVQPQLMIWITSLFPSEQRIFSTFLELEYDPSDRDVKLCYIGGGLGTDAVMANKEGLIRETYKDGSVGEYERFYRYFYADGSGALSYLYAVGLQDLGISAEGDAHGEESLYLAAYFMERSRSADSYADPELAGMHTLHRVSEDSEDPTLQYEPDGLSDSLTVPLSAADGIELCGSEDVIRRLLKKADGLGIPAHALQAEDRIRRFYSREAFSMFRAMKTVRIVSLLKSGGTE